MVTLPITASEDYTDGNPPLLDITDIAFGNSGTAIAVFAASQFDGVQISPSVNITGNASQNVIQVVLSNAITFSAAGWTLSGWAGADFIEIDGSVFGGADTITGPSVSDGSVRIYGADGADVLTGGAANNFFHYESFTGVDAGEQIIGGSLTDSIEPVGDGSTYDFTVVQMSSVERLSLTNIQAGTSTTVILSGTQIGAGAITQVDGTTISDHNLIVNGASVDLSTVTFNNWTNGADSIAINGTGGLDTLTGSDQDDTIRGFAGGDMLRGGGGNDTVRGGRGKDSLFGGADSDLFDFNSIKESVTGAKRDVIQDFQHGPDHVDLNGIDAKSGVSGNQNFKFIGKSDFHDKKGELRYEDKGTKVIVQGDVNGDGKADFEILVKIEALFAGDFLL